MVPYTLPYLFSAIPVIDLTDPAIGGRILLQIVLKRGIAMFSCDFSAISERDMDMLFLETFATDPDFAEFIVGRTEFKERPFTVVSAVLSQTEPNLGESDLTFILEADGKRFGILFCPQKYHQLNDEAQKYEHFISYENFRDYFASKQDALSLLRRQQLDQAIQRAKKPSKTEIDKAANAYYVKYWEYR